MTWIQVAGDECSNIFDKLYKANPCYSKQCLDIVGALFGLLVCGTVSLSILDPIIHGGWKAFFVKKQGGKNGRLFKVLSSVLSDAEIKKELMEHLCVAVCSDG